LQQPKHAEEEIKRIALDQQQYRLKQEVGISQRAIEVHIQRESNSRLGRMRNSGIAHDSGRFRGRIRKTAGGNAQITTWGQENYLI